VPRSPQEQERGDCSVEVGRLTRRRRRSCAGYHRESAVADLLGIYGPAVLAILCVVAAVRVHRRADAGTAPAAPDEDEAPHDVPPDDGQVGDLARALRQARKQRHS
jgi:hypothetical protein